MEVQAGADMADGALWLYHLAFQELQRSIASDCRQRGELLSACWWLSAPTRARPYSHLAPACLPTGETVHERTRLVEIEWQEFRLPMHYATECCEFTGVVGQRLQVVIATPPVTQSHSTRYESPTQAEAMILTRSGGCKCPLLRHREHSIVLAQLRTSLEYENALTIAEADAAMGHAAVANAQARDGCGITAILLAANTLCAA